MFTIGASSQYKMYSISEVFCSIEKLYTMYIHTNRRASSVGHSWRRRPTICSYPTVLEWYRSSDDVLVASLDHQTGLFVVGTEYMDRVQMSNETNAGIQIKHFKKGELGTYRVHLLARGYNGISPVVGEQSVSLQSNPLSGWIMYIGVHHCLSCTSVHIIVHHVHQCRSLSIMYISAHHCSSCNSVHIIVHHVHQCTSLFIMYISADHCLSCTSVHIIVHHVIQCTSLFIMYISEHHYLSCTSVHIIVHHVHHTHHCSSCTSVHIIVHHVHQCTSLFIMYISADHCLSCTSVHIIVHHVFQCTSLFIMYISEHHYSSCTSVHIIVH